MGSYLALDVGGTNLRVVSVRLTGGGQISTRQTKYKIDESLKVGDAKYLFGKSDCATISTLESCSLSSYLMSDVM